jgi:hypothetical protein
VFNVLVFALGHGKINEKRDHPSPEGDPAADLEQLSRIKLLNNTSVVNRTIVEWHGPKMLQCLSYARVL